MVCPPLEKNFFLKGLDRPFKLVQCSSQHHSWDTVPGRLEPVLQSSRMRLLLFLEESTQSWGGWSHSDPNVYVAAGGKGHMGSLDAGHLSSVKSMSCIA